MFSIQVVTPPHQTNKFFTCCTTQKTFSKTLTLIQSLMCSQSFAEVATFALRRKQPASSEGSTLLCTFDYRVEFYQSRIQTSNNYLNPLLYNLDKLDY